MPERSAAAECDLIPTQGALAFDAIEPAAEQELYLHLHVRDPEVVAALVALPVREREQHALAALKLGVLALQQARGEIDAVRVRHEGERMLFQLEQTLGENATRLVHELDKALREYLDPSSGRFAHRIDKLLAHDGELDAVLRRHVAGHDSEIGKTLALHVGQASPLLRVLDPSQSDGLMQSWQRSLEHALLEQRERVLTQFSLDEPTSALSRLVARITDEHGRLKKDFAEDFGKLAQQFSLDDGDSALSRMLRQVEHAQRSIVQQFSLDDDASALSRLRREFTTTLGTLLESQHKFQQEVSETLSALAARKQTEARTPVHGLQFEERLSAFLSTACGRTGDVFQACGAQPGHIRNCKKGDQVIELGDECVGAGGRIVFEAKQDQSFDDRKALEEIDLARKNRDAEVGVFVFSARIAGDRPRLRRFGNDVLVVWDPDEANGDAFLDAAVSLARALVVRARARTPQVEIDLVAFDAAILDIERQAAKLDKIRGWGESIQSSATKIIDEARRLREALERRTHELSEHMGAVKKALQPATP